MESTSPARVLSHLDRETPKYEHELNIARMNQRLEAVRMAQQTLMENARNRPVNERTVTAENITAFAEELLSTIGE
jgi:hypothetical protein